MKYNINEMLDLIEKFNFDKIKYRHSFKFRVRKFLSMSKKCFYGDFSNFHNYLLSRRLRKYEIRKPIINVNFKSVFDKKIVVYSCILGNYDNICEPLYFNDNVSYVLFSDIDIKSSYWQIRKIPKKILKKYSNLVDINRYLKLHPFEFFGDYDYSIYLDGNIKTLTDISGFVDKVNSKTGLAMFQHHSRNCLYMEEKACLLQKKGNSIQIKKQIFNYRKEGFPKQFGMIEGSIIVSDLNNMSAKMLLSKWWEEYWSSGSMRDQLSFPYVLWKNHYCIDDIGFLGNNLRACPKLIIKSHNNLK